MGLVHSASPSNRGVFAGRHPTRSRAPQNDLRAPNSSFNPRLKTKYNKRKFHEHNRGKREKRRAWRAAVLEHIGFWNSQAVTLRQKRPNKFLEKKKKSAVASIFFSFSAAGMKSQLLRCLDRALQNNDAKKFKKNVPKSIGVHRFATAYYPRDLYKSGF